MKNTLIRPKDGQASKETRDGHTEKGGHHHKNSGLNDEEEFIKDINKLLNNFSTIKPTNSEAQRILTVIEDLIERLEILVILDHSFVTSIGASGAIPAEFYQQLDPTIMGLLKTEAELEIAFANFSGNSNLVDAGSNKEVEKNAADLEDNIRVITKELRRKRDSVEVLRKLKGAQAGEAYSHFLLGMKCLKIIYQTRLSTPAEEEESKRRQIEELRKRIEELEKTQKGLQMELINLDKQRTEELAKKNDEIKKLRDHTKDVEDRRKKDSESMNKESGARMSEKSKAFEDEKKKLMEEVKKLRAEMDEMKAKNLKKEMEIKKDITGAEGTLTEILRDYDQIMEQKTKEYNDEQAKLQKLKDTLKEKQDYYEKIAEERAREVELDRQWREKIKRHDLDRKKNNEAAERVLMFLRAFHNKKAGDKKKKKKGKKKK